MSKKSERKDYFISYRWIPNPAKSLEGMALWKMLSAERAGDIVIESPPLTRVGIGNIRDFIKQNVKDEIGDVDGQVIILSITELVREGD